MTDETETTSDDMTDNDTISDENTNDFGIDLLPVGADGKVQPAAGNFPHSQPLPAPSLVCLMLANNEVGTLQPMRAVTELAHAAGAWVHERVSRARRLQNA